MFCDMAKHAKIELQAWKAKNKGPPQNLEKIQDIGNKDPRRNLEEKQDIGNSVRAPDIN